MARVLVIQCEGLKFDYLYKSEKNDMFYKGMVYQSLNFFNFRYPESEDQLDSVPHALSKMFEKDFHFITSDKDIGELGENFCIFYQGAIKNKRQSRVFQDSCQSIIDRLDEIGALEETYIVIMGSGFCGNKKVENKFSIKKMKNTLYDRYTHAPLLFFIPGKRAMDIGNSIGLPDILRTISELNEKGGDADILTIPKRDKEKRFDIYSFQKNGKIAISGIRGPMFQYFAWIDISTKEIIYQECYDLNNDTDMKNNLALVNDKSNFVILIMQEYAIRVKKFIEGKI